MFWLVLLLKLLLDSEFCKNSALISFVQVPVGFCDLFDGVSYQVGDDHEVGAKVDQHGYKRMTEVMNAYWLHFCLGTIVAEYTSQSIIGDGMFAAEEEGGLAFIVFQLFLLNIIVLFLSLASVVWIGEEIPWKELLLLHLAYFLLQLEIGGICFGISAFLRRGSLGIGLGIAVILYFFNIIANISEAAGFLKYITPFGYAEGTDIITNVSLDIHLVILGMIYGIIGILFAYWKYSRKDIL